MRVLIVSSHTLFGQEMDEWLRQQTGVDIVGRETDIESAAPSIEQLRPDVILLDIGEEANDPTSALMRFLRDRLETKIIGVHLRDGCLCIYCKKQHLIEEMKGFLEVMGE